MGHSLVMRFEPLAKWGWVCNNSWRTHGKSENNMDDLGVPPFLGNLHIYRLCLFHVCFF